MFALEVGWRHKGYYEIMFHGAFAFLVDMFYPLI